MRNALPILLLATACADTPDGRTTPPDLAPWGVFEVGKPWPIDDLVVCWMPDAYDDANLQAARIEFELVVQREWGRLGRIRFNRIWTRCDYVPEAHIRIGLQDIPGGRSELGIDALFVPIDEPTMTVNFSSSGGCPPGATKECPTKTKASGSVIHHLALHEFGHALGFRHEHARSDASCPEDEALDDDDYDGEPLWSYDAESIMNYCVSHGSEGPRLSVGDIRSLHTVYPGVVAVFDGTSFDKLLANDEGLRLGPGYYTRATAPAIAAVSSIVVPPGLKVRACTRTECMWVTESLRELGASYDNQIEDLAISPWVVAAEEVGYGEAVQWLWLGVAGESTGALGPVAGTVSSLWVPPTRAASPCTIEDRRTGAGECDFAVGGAGPTLVKLGPQLDDRIESVHVTPRVVTYSDRQFRGERHVLDAGVYKVSTHGDWLRSIRALAVSGLSVAACTDENGLGPIQGGGGGTCVTFQQSIDLDAAGLPPIRYLEIAPIPVNAPP